MNDAFVAAILAVVYVILIGFVALMKRLFVRRAERAGTSFIAGDGSVIRSSDSPY